MKIRTKKTPVAWQQPLGQPRGDTLIGVFTSTSPDVLYPWHPQIVKAIRENYDNEYVPLFQRKVYRTRTGGTYVLRAHGLGKQVAAPEGKVRELLLASVPTGYGSTWHPNNCALWMPVSWFQFGWHLFYDFRRIFVRGSVKEQEAVMDEPVQQRAKAKAETEAEHNYRVDHDQKQIQEQIDDGRLTPAPREKKPYVFHGGKTREVA